MATVRFPNWRRLRMIASGTWAIAPRMRVIPSTAEKPVGVRIVDEVRGDWCKDQHQAEQHDRTDNSDDQRGVGRPPIIRQVHDRLPDTEIMDRLEKRHNHERYGYGAEFGRSDDSRDEDRRRQDRNPAENVADRVGPCRRARPSFPNRGLVRRPVQSASLRLRLVAAIELRRVGRCHHDVRRRTPASTIRSIRGSDVERSFKAGRIVLPESNATRTAAMTRRTGPHTRRHGWRMSACSSHRPS